jgi:hypothetical protein
VAGRRLGQPLRRLLCAGVIGSRAGRSRPVVSRTRLPDGLRRPSLLGLGQSVGRGSNRRCGGACGCGVGWGGIGRSASSNICRRLRVNGCCVNRPRVNRSRVGYNGVNRRGIHRSGVHRRGIIWCIAGITIAAVVTRPPEAQRYAPPTAGEPKAPAAAIPTTPAVPAATRIATAVVTTAMVTAPTVIATSVVAAASSSCVVPTGVRSEGKCQHCHCDRCNPDAFHKLLHSKLPRVHYYPVGHLQDPPPAPGIGVRGPASPIALLRPARRSNRPGQ